jgi:hypothetical protein
MRVGSKRAFVEEKDPFGACFSPAWRPGDGRLHDP